MSSAFASSSVARILLKVSSAPEKPGPEEGGVLEVTPSNRVAVLSVSSFQCWPKFLSHLGHGSSYNTKLIISLSRALFKKCAHFSARSKTEGHAAHAGKSRPAARNRQAWRRHPVKYNSDQDIEQPCYFLMKIGPRPDRPRRLVKFERSAASLASGENLLNCQRP